MATIQRPTKQGGTTTYQAKVAAGYKNILASEMDADLDTIYSAWNTGVDTVNIADGSITGPKLAAGAVGSRELADSGIQTADIANGAVTQAKLASGVTVPPSGNAGGDLSGTYPNPAIGTVQNGNIYLNPRGMLNSAAGPGTVDLLGNQTGVIGYDSAKPSYLLRLDYSADNAEVWRAAVGQPGNFIRLFYVKGSDGKTYCTLADLSVTRGQLAVNSAVGGITSLPVPVSFSVPTPSTWTTYVTLPAITTRGGMVFLVAQTNLSVSGAGGSGLVAQRWIRDVSTVVTSRSQLISTAPGTFVPLSGINAIEGACPAGSHTYAYQVLLQSPLVIQASGTTEGVMEAIEIG